MQYKLIIFDFDGTLADTFPWFTRVINQVAAKYRFNRIDPERMDTVKAYSARQLLQYLDIPLRKVPTIAGEMRKRMAEEIETITLFDGIELLLRQMSASGIKLALVSSNSPDNIARVLGTDILSLFAWLECGVSLFGKVSKLKRVLRKSKIDADEALFIGDEVRDIEAAKKAKVAAGAVVWGYNSLEKLKEMNPDELFLEVDDLLARLG